MPHPDSSADSATAKLTGTLGTLPDACTARWIRAVRSMESRPQSQHLLHLLRDLIDPGIPVFLDEVADPAHDRSPRQTRAEHQAAQRHGAGHRIHPLQRWPCRRFLGAQYCHPDISPKPPGTRLKTFSHAYTQPRTSQTWASLPPSSPPTTPR